VNVPFVPDAAGGPAFAAKSGMPRNSSRKWGARLNTANSTLVVRCYTCLAEGLVPDRGPTGADLDRADWPVVKCMFTDGCDGYAVPEALN